MQFIYFLIIKKDSNPAAQGKGTDIIAKKKQTDIR